MTQNNFGKDGNLIDRLLYYVASQGSNFNKLATHIGISNSYFSKMKRNRGSIGADIIEKILQYYDNLDAEWLLTGKGNMLKEYVQNDVSGYGVSAQYLSAKETDRVQLLLLEKDQRIDDLKAIIETQKELISELKSRKTKEN